MTVIGGANGSTFGDRRFGGNVRAMSAMNRRDWIRSIAYSAAAAPLLNRRLDAMTQNSSPSRAYRYIHLDVFTDRRLAGNQLLVYVDPEGLDADAMARLTLESNYSENTFVFPPEQAGTDVRVRIFGRGGEMPFAGHPTIGTAFALAHTGRIKPGTTSMVFGLGVGPTPIDLEWKGSQLAFAWMTQLKPTFGKTIADAAAVASAIGLQAVDVAAAEAPAAQEVHTGSNFVIVPLASRKAVDAAVLDRPKLDALRTANGLTGRGVYVFTTEPGGDNATSYSRLLPGPGGIEDPATGSAAGPAGSFMVKYGFVPPEKAGSIVNTQGVLVKRPSRIHIKVASAGGEITQVKVGGVSVVVGEGTSSV
jgi:trans-2,3-dihydro-3-hydroxyanthranilate isomerase